MDAQREGAEQYSGGIRDGASSKVRKSNTQERVVTTACCSHCGGACLLKVHIANGTIVRIETDNAEEPQLRACLLGRAYRQRVYAPDRLKFPMRRVGARGEGKFERISWDEALDTVAKELKRVSKTYGPSAILFRLGVGDLCELHSWKVIDRLLSMTGCSKTWGYNSFEAGIFASLATYGTMVDTNSREDLLNSKLIIMWGWNPAVTVAGVNTCWYLAQAKEAGVKVISVDPRYTDSAATFTNQWIPILPGTDTAMLIAMAYVIIKNNLQDQAFLDIYTIGFEQFKNYVMGAEDNIPKTPAWAESITGVPATTTENLATEYATTKPAALLCGIAPGRTAYGEQYHRAAITLAAMTGNIGIHGGNSAGRIWTQRAGGYPFLALGGKLALHKNNPVEKDVPPRKYALPAYGESTSSARVNNVQVADAILKGRDGGYFSDYKLLYIVNTNFPNQYPNINKSVRALENLEFIVVHEQYMTPAAKLADIVLPTCTIFERNDVTAGYGTPFLGYIHKVVEPLYESKAHFEIAVELAARLGISDFSDKTEDEWLREIVKYNSYVSDYDKFKEKGFQKIELPEPYVAFKEQITDPANYPFPTPSGKIEIYSQQVAEMNHPKLPPIPKYLETWESRNDPLAKKYPLQLITTHLRRRTNTQFETIPWLRELPNQAQAMLINSIDAKSRGINNGDMVRVFNDRGETIILAKITERIMPGVVDIPQGAQYDLDENGVDRGGSPNILTRDEPSPGGAMVTNTCLVQVEKI
jgi:anaerobic dimethyl sulfoxide reductase subunit A